MWMNDVIIILKFQADDFKLGIQKSFFKKLTFTTLNEKIFFTPPMITLNSFKHIYVYITTTYLQKKKMLNNLISLCLILCSINCNVSGIIIFCFLSFSR